jgi:putative ABC transport system permease protein
MTSPDARLTSPRPAGAWRGVLRLAWRESRNARRRLLLFMSGISAGVAALVAIDSFSANVTRSVREQSRSLLGGDVAISTRRGWTDAAERMLDSLDRSGKPVARITSFASMATAPGSESARLSQIRAVSEEYPFYGEIETAPAGRWTELHRGPNALVDTALLIALDARIGDSLQLGRARFAIIGTLRSVPGDVGISSAFGPRVYVPARFLPEMGLLGFGSRSDHDALVRLPPDADAQAFVAALRPTLERERLRSRTVEQTERDLTEGIDQLRRFLGLVGLVALLLGGIGVASAMHAYASEKRDTAAILRCLGATSGQVLAIYAVEAAAMGLLGAAVGAAAGVAAQLALPRVMAGFVPVDVVPRLEPAAVATGLAVGVIVSLLFALRPLLALRRTSPLAVLRQNAGGALRRDWRDPLQLLAALLLAGGVAGVAAARAETALEGLAMSAGLAAVVGVLLASAALLAWLARRGVRDRWPFVFRQGVANLYRPGNQTRAVMLSLGFGAFLLSTLYLVQTNLLARLRPDADASRANLFLFDIQADQVAGVDSMVRAGGFEVTQRVPMIQMRVASVKGVPAADLAKTQPSWALRREYRSSWRDSVNVSEKLLAGTWFERRRGAPPDSVWDISLDEEIARELRVRIGDRITWDVQGVAVATRVRSLREVNWARFEPNFFVVFEPGSLDQAPATFVVLAYAADAGARARLQRALVDRYPNVSAIDLSLVRQAVAGVLDRIAVAVRFMALFSLATGVLVLLGAVAASRRQRVREGVLLKTLGATRPQIRRIMLAEYAALGALGSATGMLLSVPGGWALTRFVFEQPFVPAVGPLLWIAAGMMLLTVSIGLTSGRRVFAAPPMQALREA